MSVDAAGDLRCQQTWSPSWILPRVRNQAKTVAIGDFLCLTSKNNL